MDPSCRMMPEKLDHSSGWFQIFPNLVKCPQANLGHLESYREVRVRRFPKEPPAFPFAEQVKVNKGLLMDSEALFQVRKKQAPLILVCKSWP